MKGIVAVCAAMSVVAPAFADDLRLYPIQTGAESVRYRTGIPTLNLETATGGVEITPLPFDHGHVTFGLGFYNKGTAPVNIGIENITATIQGQDTVVLSSEELQKRAKSRATWSAVGIALLAGAAAAASANAHTTQTYHSRMVTPHGTYSWVSSYRDNSIGVLGATASVAAGTAGIVGIQNRLDYTLANLSTEIVQTTTVDPETSYGGRIEVEKSDKMKAPYDVKIMVSFNGQSYPFVFRVTKPGNNVPAPYVMAQATPAAAVLPAVATTAPTASALTPATVVAPAATLPSKAPVVGSTPSSAAPAVKALIPTAS